MSVLTVAQAAAWAQTLGLPRHDAQVLLLHALGRAPHDRAWLLAHGDDTLDAATQMDYLCLQDTRQTKREGLVIANTIRELLPPGTLVLQAPITKTRPSDPSPIGGQVTYVLSIALSKLMHEYFLVLHYQSNTLYPQLLVPKYVGNYKLHQP